MFLRRITSRTKRLDWAAVCIEFVLVIFGVLIALQVSNWNASRNNQEGAGNTLTRLRGEIVVNIAALDDRLAVLEGSSEVRRAGLMALQTCEASPESLEKLSQAAGQLTGDIIPSFVDSTLRELARQDRYLDLLSNDFRAALNIYSGRLADERDQLRINFGLMWDQHVIKHPTIGIDIKNADVLTSTFVFNQPLEVLCKDSAFRRQFAMTESWHQSTMHRMQRFKGWCEEFLLVIDAEIEALG